MSSICINRRRALCGAVGLALLPPSHAQPARAWPAAPVQIVVAMPPGGTSANLASLVAAQLAGQTGVVFDTIERSDLPVAAVIREVAQGRADGRVALIASNMFVGNAVALPDAGYNPLRDFRPVGLLGKTPTVLLASRRLGAGILPALLAGRLPGQTAMPLRLATFGAFTTSHRAAEALRAQAVTPLAITHFRGQTAALGALQSDHADLLFANLPESLRLVRRGEVAALAITSPTRSPLLPEVPTMQESGGTSTALSWYALVVPAAVPDAVVADFNAALNEALQATVVQRVMRTMGVRPHPGTPAELGELMRAEMSVYEQLARASMSPAHAPGKLH